jgi:hypothetical protein
MFTHSFAAAITAVGLISGPVPALTSPLVAGQIRNSESAIHAFDAAWHQVKDTYPLPNFQVTHFQLGVLSRMITVVRNPRFHENERRAEAFDQDCAEPPRKGTMMSKLVLVRVMVA